LDQACTMLMAMVISRLATTPAPTIEATRRSIHRALNKVSKIDTVSPTDIIEMRETPTSQTCSKGTV
jgi:hypothetical protein